MQFFNNAENKRHDWNLTENNEQNFSNNKNIFHFCKNAENKRYNCNLTENNEQNFSNKKIFYILYRADILFRHHLFLIKLNLLLK